MTRTRIPMLAHAFVILAIIALAIGPVVMVHRLSVLEAEIGSVVRPVRQLGAELGIALERQVAEKREFHLAQLLEEPEDARRAYRLYRDARADELALHAQLALLAQQISRTSVARLDSLRDISPRWHELDDALLAGRMTLVEYTPQLPRQRALQDSAYAVLARLQDELGRAEAESVAATATLLRRD